MSGTGKFLQSISIQIPTTFSTMINQVEGRQDYILDRIVDTIGRAGAYVMNHPAELQWFEALSHRELDELAIKHGLNVVRHSGSIHFTHRASVMKA